MKKRGWAIILTFIIVIAVALSLVFYSPVPRQKIPGEWSLKLCDKWLANTTVNMWTKRCAINFGETKELIVLGGDMGNTFSQFEVHLLDIIGTGEIIIKLSVGPDQIWEKQYPTPLNERVFVGRYDGEFRYIFPSVGNLEGIGIQAIVEFRMI